MAKREREERAAIAERESRLIKEREQEEARRLEEERKEKAKKAEAERTEQQLNGIAQNWKEVFSSVGYKLWLEVTKGEGTSRSNQFSRWKNCLNLWLLNSGWRSHDMLKRYSENNRKEHAASMSKRITLNQIACCL